MKEIMILFHRNQRGVVRDRDVHMTSRTCHLCNGPNVHFSSTIRCEKPEGFELPRNPKSINNR